jgi:hypothetical protein
MRVYVPSTMELLAAAYHAGEIGPAPMTAYAVTPALREWYVEGGEEELEYAALMQAARASLGLLAAAGQAMRAAGDSMPAPDGTRRVVLACETGAVLPQPGGTELGEARLDLGTVVPWTAVAAVHVDSPDAEPVVAAAVRAWDAAQSGDEDAAFTVEASEGEELQWYATQEVPDLLKRS